MAPRPLRELARLYGVQLSYRNAAGRYSTSPTESVRAVLAALGADLAGPGGIEAALRARRRELASRFVEPVAVAWEGLRPVFVLQVPLLGLDAPVGVEVRLDGGEVIGHRWRGSEAAASDETEVDGERYVLRTARLPWDVPSGYHRARVECAGRSGETTLIAAPTRCVQPTGRQWGVFLPLYALWTERSWGIGDYTDLGALRDWAGAAGAASVGTLPLLPLFLDEPYDPSPYAPVTRLLWNELYVDPEAEPEFQHCSSIWHLFESPEVRSELAALRAARQVDYRRAFRLKRQVLEMMERCCREHLSGRRDSLERFAAERPGCGTTQSSGRCATAIGRPGGHGPSASGAAPSSRVTTTPTPPASTCTRSGWPTGSSSDRAGPARPACISICPSASTPADSTRGRSAPRTCRAYRSALRRTPSSGWARTGASRRFIPSGPETTATRTCGRSSHITPGTLRCSGWTT
ncbi:MAG: 4-alpha-glucanotransferase [Gemmatimonadetes bacterium]|nr:4-alpha-glucanotransferase [Gemmatimonadota bacterium]